MFDKSYERKQAEELLSKGQPGDKITIDAMAKAVGHPCWRATDKGYPAVRAAMIGVCKQHKIHWIRDPDQGCYVCARPKEILETTDAYLRRIRHSASRTLDVGACATGQQMNNELTLKHGIAMAVAGVARESVSFATQKAIAGRSSLESTAKLRLIIEGANDNGEK